MQSRASVGDDVKYFAMTVVLAMHVEGGPEQVRVYGLALDHLVAAVKEDERGRARCRDTDVGAATRQRAW